MSKPPPADWQLPPGVNRGLWDYLHDPDIARGYDASLAGTPLFDIDRRFVEQHCPQPGRLLDLGCGTGRLLLAMAQRGWWTLGVDLSTEMLRVAGDKAMSAGVVVHRLRANIAELDALADGSFDCVACLFSTLGMVLGAAQRQRVVAQAFRLLRPGGRFILHVHNRWFNAWTEPGRTGLLRDGLRAWTGDERGDRVMPVHQGIAGLTLHLFTRREACRLLTDAGFRVREVWPISLRADGRVRCPAWFGWLRAYGYLLAAERTS
ncbi:MAG TPA: class I SAM-dependent methyltransferase [Gemmataceae bacterium]|nr:class I SAM-dependent methyltransferase [Gemmataceae bacterium]